MGSSFTPGTSPATICRLPSVSPYWAALTAANGPEDPFIWKLWLLPFALVHVLASLVLSPICHGFGIANGSHDFVLTHVPSLIESDADIPALTLALAAMFCYFRGVDCCTRSSGWGWIVLSGLLAGLATQTKYTAFVPVAAIGLHALFILPCSPWLCRWPFGGFYFRWLGTVCRLAARRVHFLVSIHRLSPTSEQLNQIAPICIGFMGGLAPGLLLLGLLALPQDGG